MGSIANFDAQKSMIRKCLFYFILFFKGKDSLFLIHVIT